jgi:hypothetical protein
MLHTDLPSKISQSKLVAVVRGRILRNVRAADDVEVFQGIRLVEKSSGVGVKERNPEFSGNGVDVHDPRSNLCRIVAVEQVCVRAGDRGRLPRGIARSRICKSRAYLAYWR